MEQLQKLWVDTAFRAGLLKVCRSNQVSLPAMSISIRIFDKGVVKLSLCLNKAPEQPIDVTALMNTKFIALRFGIESIQYLMRCVHYVFVREGEPLKPESISLLLYESKLAHCPCIGILKDGKPLKALRVVDLFEAMKLGSEQLN